MSELGKIRQAIDEIDRKMAALFEERMKQSAAASAYKKANKLPIYVPEREQQMLEDNAMWIDEPALRPYYRAFLRNILDLSKDYQRTLGAGTITEGKDWNIVLSGMPGSGKSAVSRILAEKTGRPLIDTDEVIVKRTGITIREIFSRYGELYFRNLESEVIREVAGAPGQILSIGGGAILRRENVRALHQSGRIYFLDRDPALIEVSMERPLADTREKLFDLYHDRYAVYLATADERVEITSPEEAAEKILLSLKEKGEQPAEPEPSIRQERSEDNQA